MEFDKIMEEVKAAKENLCNGFTEYSKGSKDDAEYLAMVRKACLDALKKKGDKVILVLKK